MTEVHIVSQKHHRIEKEKISLYDLMIETKFPFKMEKKHFAFYLISLL